MSRDEILHLDCSLPPMSSYQSPITIVQKKIVEEMAESIDGEVMRYVKKIGVDIDREELLKALKYDRDQYEKGYNNGVIYATNKMTPKKLEVWNGQACCPACDRLFGNMVDLKHFDFKRLIPNYCPDCGQRLDWDKDQ